MPRVSVVTSTFNRPELLKRAATSVAAQTYRDFEHIVVEDFGNKPPAVVEGARVAAMPAFEGPFGIPCRNLGAKLATGELLAFLDDDNWWEPHHLLTLVALLDSTAADFVWGSSFLWRGAEQIAIRDSGIPSWQNIDISEIVCKKELFDRFGGLLQKDENGADGKMAERWTASGARYAHSSVPTLNYTMGGSVGKRK